MKKKKILILSASPRRDSLNDEILAEKLRKRGHDVWVYPCLREGRSAVMNIKPDVAIIPPIRNIYSRNFVEKLKKWNIGVVSRHTEASCAWEDYKPMLLNEKAEILGKFKYFIDLEIVWSQDEKQILERRSLGFPIVSVGAFVADIYKWEGLKNKIPSRARFNAKHKLNSKKKTLLIASAWGYIDSSPDLRIDGQMKCKHDTEGRSRWIKMVKGLRKNLPDWNILTTIHHNVGIKPYREALGNIEVDTESTATELLVNCDALIHTGSTLAVEMHLLNRPAFQYGDTNNLPGANWWQKSGVVISRFSPRYKSIKKLAEAIKTTRKSNAIPEVVKELEEGRYGKLDGHATDRAIQHIEKISGRFTEYWPDETEDYSQITILRYPTDIITGQLCGICKKRFVTVNDEWLAKLQKFIGCEKEIKSPFDACCPHCCTRFFKDEEMDEICE